MVEFTKGPWSAKLSKYTKGTLIVQAGMPSNRVLARFGSEDELLDNIDWANARLIAAAPDLLEALQWLRDEMVRRPQIGFKFWIERIDAALSKATTP